MSHVCEKVIQIIERCKTRIYGKGAEEWLLHYFLYEEREKKKEELHIIGI